jgi:hypothetical protein
MKGRKQKEWTMTTKEQLDRLYKLQEDIRTLQNSGLWDSLSKAKTDVITLINHVEERNPDLKPSWKK